MNRRGKKRLENRLAGMQEEIDFAYTKARNKAKSTRERYYAIMVNFIEFLADYIKLKSLKNLKMQHIEKYIGMLIKDKNLSINTARIHLDAIYYYMDNIEHSNKFKNKIRFIREVKTWEE